MSGYHEMSQKAVTFLGNEEILKKTPNCEDIWAGYLQAWVTLRYSTYDVNT